MLYKILLTASSTEGSGTAGTGPNRRWRQCFLNEMADVAELGSELRLARNRRAAGVEKALCLTGDAH